MAYVVGGADSDNATKGTDVGAKRVVPNDEERIVECGVWCLVHQMVCEGDDGATRCRNACSY